MNGELETTAKDSLSILADTKVEIYFSYALTSLESFFDSVFDDKMEYLKSVDLSYLDATQITSFVNLFNECSALKSVTPTKVPTFSLTTMKSMFDGYESIVYIDLSKYYTSLVTNMDFLFYGFNSLKAIDMSCISFQNLVSTKSLLYGTDDLAILSYNDKIGSSPVLTQTFIELYSNGNVNLCMAPNCCDIDPENGECKISSNFITITYGRDAKYSSFQNTQNYPITNLRIGKTLIGPRDSFEVKNGTKVDILFSNELSGMPSIFKDNVDIISVDFSNFNSSKISEISDLFNGCSSLKSVDLTRFKLLQIKSLQNVFKNCKELTSVNISYISSSKIETVENCFEGCSSLKVLDISGLDLFNLNSYDRVFYEATHLKYLKTIGSSIGEGFKQQIPKNNLIVCQDQENKIITDKNVINKCCDLNEDIKKYYASNYIVVYYTSNNLDNQLPITLTNGLGFNNNNYDYSDKISSLTLNNQEIFSVGQSLDI